MGRTTSWSPKSYCVYGPENEIAAVTFFTKTNTAVLLQVQQNGRIPGNTVADSRSPAPPAGCPSLPKHHVVLEVFGCFCRRLSQHGLGEVLILRRHCRPDAFFCVCVGSGSFCHDWASHCSVLFSSFDALFVLDPPHPFAPLDS